MVAILAFNNLFSFSKPALAGPASPASRACASTLLDSAWGEEVGLGELGVVWWA